jgi:CRP/FNR family transcriptional regulator, cyclic AMP receptor protein
MTDTIKAIKKQESPEYGNIFKRFRAHKSITNVEVLKLCPLFQRLTDRELKKVSRIIYERRYQAGEYLFEKEQPGTAMFIIKSGLVKVVIHGPDDDETVLATINPEDFLGELALLDDTPRSASAKAVEKTEALAFFREDLNDLLQTFPSIGSKILKELSIIIGQRLKAANEQLYSRGN